VNPFQKAADMFLRMLAASALFLPLICNAQEDAANATHRAVWRDRRAPVQQEMHFVLPSRSRNAIRRFWMGLSLPATKGCLNRSIILISLAYCCQPNAAEWQQWRSCACDAESLMCVCAPGIDRPGK